MQNRKESKGFRLSGYFLIVFGLGSAIYKFIFFFEDRAAFVHIILVSVMLPFATLTFTEGHSSQTVDQLVKRTEQMLEFNYILDNLKEYVTILDCKNDPKNYKFRYVNEQFLRHFSHLIVPSDSE